MCSPYGRPPPLSFAQPPPRPLKFAQGGSAEMSRSGSAPALEVRYHGPPRGAPPSNNLYVKGLPPSITKPQVAALFGAFGTVTDMRVMPGSQDAAALVRMASEEEATAAIEELSGLQWDSILAMQDDPVWSVSAEEDMGSSRSAPSPRAARWQPCQSQRPALQFASPPAPSPRGGPSQLQVRFHGKGADAPPSDNLYVKGLSRDTSEGDLRAMFSSAGTVTSVKIMPSSTDSIALVRMGSIEEAENAIRLLDSSAPMASNNLPVPEVRYHGPKGAPPSDNLYVKGLPLHITPDDIHAIFAVCGTVVDMRIMPPAFADARDCTALVRMASLEEGMAAVHMFGSLRNGSPAAGKGEAPPRTAPVVPHAWRPASLGKGGNAPASMGKGREILQLELRYYGPPGAPPSDNLYVKGLPKNITRDGIIDLFGCCGEVVDMRIMGGKGHAPDATALVRMASLEQAAAAIEILGGGSAANGLNHDTGSPANEGHVMEEGEEVGEQARPSLEVRYHGPPGAPPSDNLYVKGLPNGIPESEVTELFSEFGTVVRIRVMPSQQGRADCTALVRMGSQEEADTAIANLNTAPERSSSFGHRRSSPY